MASRGSFPVRNDRRRAVNRRQNQPPPGPSRSTANSRRPNGLGQGHQARLRGVIVHLKEDRTFGFIKPLETLPQGFTDKNVHFKPHGVRFEQGDTVEFVLRDTDKARPSASNVYLVKRGRVSVRSHLVAGQERTLGTVEGLGIDGKGWIRVIDELPAEYQGKSENVYFEQSWVSCGHLDLVNGDIVEFNISQSKKRAEELSAYKIKLKECRQRTPDNIRDYMKKVLTLIESNDVLMNIFSCDAVWEALSQCKDITLVMEILDFIQILQKKSHGRLEHFRQALKTLVSSGFCDIQEGALKLLIERDWDMESLCGDDQRKIKHFLLAILEYVPEKSRLAMKLIKLMLPNGQSGFDHFMYDALKLTIREKEGDVEDLDWNELPLVPTTAEMLSPAGSLSRLKPVHVKGPYEAPEEYMDTYFRLLRADCFSALQSGIDDYLENSLDPRDMKVYTEVALAGIHISTTGSGLVLALKLKPPEDVKNWVTSSSLMSGNLLCLSPSGSFKDVIWATVAKRDEKLLKTTQTIWVELAEDLNTHETSKCLIFIKNASGKIVMAESPTYYKAYEPVLKTLQQINPSELPFQEELIYMDSLPQPSPYALKKERDSEEAPRKDITDPPLGLSTRLSLYRSRLLAIRSKGKEELDTSTMDESQDAAFKQALQNRVAIIQGPPGTGKTYIGIKIVEELLKQVSAEESDLPIVVVTYKNHALDEFMKELLQRLKPGEIVRIGGRSQEADVQNCNLQELKMKEKINSSLWFDLKDEASKLKERIECVMKDLLTAKKFSVHALLKCFTGQQIEGLLQRCYANIFDESANQWYRVYARDILPTWHEWKDVLLDQESKFSEKWHKAPHMLLKFIEAAIQQWVPSKEDFQRMMHGDSILPTFVPAQAPKKKKKRKQDLNEQDVLPDEKDIEEEEKERAAVGGSSQREFTMNIDLENHEKNTQHLLQMTPSAEHLAGEISLTNVQHIQHLWSLNPYERAVVIQIAMWHNNTDVELHLEKLITRYNRIMAARQEIENQQKVGVLKKAKVVGMTITGASINQALLKMLQPSVLLVEEAAEVLEPQITAILGNCNVKHLILIGDHKQLKPPVESYNLCRNFHFDISMMERLINNGYPHTTLKLQNRMRPEIAELLSDIYPDLKSNLTRVTKNKPPDFTPSSMFFWTHKDPEEAARSYSNKKEAGRVLQLAMVCLQMGYKPKQITILAAYQGQVRLLRKMLRGFEDDKPHVFAKYKPDEEETMHGRQQGGSGYRDNPRSIPQKRTNTINIHTIDLFQGDENDIIIVSLVRSNERGQIGFLKTLNRRCVAQSRAKCGMFFVGNETTFTEAKSSCWGSLINSLHERQLVGPQFALHCPLHKGITEIRATTAEDLPLKVICKEKCNIEMKCRTHPCPQVCCPKHSHNKCEVIVDFVLPCDHPGKRRCYQSESDIRCKKPCAELMLCKKHPCPHLCAPSHSHAQKLCKKPVEFVFKECQHPGQKLCGDDESRMICNTVVTFQIRECQHQASRECWQKEEDIKCCEKCTRMLPCGHPCEGYCGNKCGITKCRFCEEKRKYEMEQRRIAEQQAREDAREAAKLELQAFIAKNPKLNCIRSDLQRDCDDASEYYDVEDRVKKFIQPGHGWFPEITRIEKITNLKLQKKFIEAKCGMVDPMRSELKFHGTNKRAIEEIIKDGFRIPKEDKRRKKMYGNGIYFATDSSKSAQAKYTKDSNMLLLCEVLIGHSLTVRKSEPQMNKETLETRRYDSVFAPRNTVQSGGVRYDEYVIFNPTQALPRYVIHYKTHSVNNVLQLQVGPTATVGKHTLLPKREFDPSDPLDMHFRLAESQFLRLTKKYGSEEKVTSVDYYTNPPLAERFEKKKLDFELKYKGQLHLAKTVLAFHGTEEKNIESIMKDNFSMAHCVTGVYGKGIYLSEFPDISDRYVKGSRKLILCNVLPGKGYTQGSNQSSLQPGFDSHKVKEDTDGRAWAHVIYFPDQILPLYVISY